MPPPAATTMGPAPASTAGQIWLGGSAELTFGNSASGKDGNGQSTSIDLVSSFGIVGTFDYQISDLLSFRAMPRYEPGLHPDGETESVSLTDIRAGVTLGKNVSPVMRVHGLVALGYGFVSFPSSASSGGGPDSASGITLTVGGGLDYALGPALRLLVEATYEKGMESISFMGQSADFNINGFELGVGIQAKIGG